MVFLVVRNSWLSVCFDNIVEALQELSNIGSCYMREDQGGDMGRKEFRNITADELREYMRMHREEDYLLVDVRNPKEYRKGHIPGARLLPVGELSARLSELPLDRDIIFY